MATQTPKEILEKQALEFQEWKDHPTTKRFYHLLQVSRQRLMEGWADSNDLGDIALNARSVGAAKTLKDILDMTSEDLFNDE